MSTYRELVYMCLDELKLFSDDSSFNENHIIFLLGKYKNLLIKQLYNQLKTSVSESNYQTICVDLEVVNEIPGLHCAGLKYLRSIKELPNLLDIGNPKVYTSSYFSGNISYVGRDRMKYAGKNKYVGNLIYATIGPDHHLYLKSNNPLFLYLKQVTMTGIFDDPEKVAELQCNKDSESKGCSILDTEFNIEAAMIPLLIELVVKELAGPAWRPKDALNDAADNLANMASFIRLMMKNEFQRQIEGS